MITYSTQKRLLFKIDCLQKFPGGGEQGHFWPAVYMLGSFEMYQIETPKIVHFFSLIFWCAANNRVLKGGGKIDRADFQFKKKAGQSVSLFGIPYGLNGLNIAKVSMYNDKSNFGVTHVFSASSDTQAHVHTPGKLRTTLGHFIFFTILSMCFYDLGNLSWLQYDLY